MKNSILLFSIFLFFSSCISYQVYIPVQSKSNIRDGTQAIVLSENLETVKKAFISSGILIKSMEGGFKTEEILIDEGTRAMYKVHEFDNQIRITAFWGVTQKVKTDMAIFAGEDAANMYDVHSWDKVVYNNKEKRPKRVFDYAVQIIESNHLKYILR